MIYRKRTQKDVTDSKIIEILIIMCSQAQGTRIMWWKPYMKLVGTDNLLFVKSKH